MKINLIEPFVSKDVVMFVKISQTLKTQRYKEVSSQDADVFCVLSVIVIDLCMLRAYRVPAI